MHSPVGIKNPQGVTLGSSAASVRSVGSSIENFNRQKPKLLETFPSPCKKSIAGKPTEMMVKCLTREQVSEKSSVFSKSSSSRSTLSPTDFGNTKNKHKASSSVVKPVLNPPDILAGTPVPHQVSFDSSKSTPRKRERSVSRSSVGDDAYNIMPLSKKQLESPFKAKRLKTSKVDKSIKSNNKSTSKISESGDTSIKSGILKMIINFDSNVRKVVTSSEKYKYLQTPA